MKTLIFFLLLVGFSIVAMFGDSSSSLLHASVNVQDTTKVEYWKQKAKIAIKELAQQEKLAAKCVADRIQLKKQLEECKSKK